MFAITFLKKSQEFTCVLGDLITVCGIKACLDLEMRQTSCHECYEAMTGMVWSVLCLLLVIFVFTNCHCLEIWFVFIEHPLQICLQQVFGESHSPNGITLKSMKRLWNCSLHIHTEQMQCTDKENPPEKISNIYQDFKVNPDEFFVDQVEECPWPAQVLTRPCGQIGVEAHVVYLFCSWIISVNYLLTINATFTYFNLPRAMPNCKLDGLQIEDMDQQKSTSRFCGRREPFSVIPNFSRLRFDLQIDWRVTLPERTPAFSMFYQVTATDKYVMPGTADYQNIYTDTSLMYGFLFSNLIMQVKEQSVFSLHFNVDIRFYIHVKFLDTFLADDTVLQVYDGPSKFCHKLTEFQSLGKNETVTSFGTSLLLVLKTRSLNKEALAVTFAGLQQQFHISPIITAENMKIDLAIPLRESKFCYAQHSVVLCSLQIVSDISDRFIKLENIFVHMKIIHIFDCNFGLFLDL